jgi:hypothetical protein
MGVPCFAGPGGTALDGAQLLAALRLRAEEVPAAKAAALLATFAQSGSGRVSYRELVAGLAPLARAAKAAAAKAPADAPAAAEDGFVARAVAQMSQYL